MIGNFDAAGMFRAAIVPRLCPVHNGGETFQNGYLNPNWNRELDINQRRDLFKIKGLKAIIGWAEPAHGGWVGMVRDDAGAMHRTGCVRSCQHDAIRAARSLVNVLRMQQLHKRSLYPDCYPMLTAPTLAECVA